MEHNHNCNCSHGHDHSHQQPTSLKNMIFTIVINGGIVVFEMIFGLVIQSMALITDAFRNLSDIVHRLFSHWAEKVARRPDLGFIKCTAFKNDGRSKDALPGYGVT